MFKINISCFILVVLFLCFTTLSTEAQMLKLKDGTILVGEIVAKPFVIETHYGVLKVPVGDIVQIVEGEFWLKNTSHFFGKIEPQTIAVKADYGELEISTKQIVWINFVKKEKPRKIDD